MHTERAEMLLYADKFNQNALGQNEHAFRAKRARRGSFWPPKRLPETTTAITSCKSAWQEPVRYPYGAGSAMESSVRSALTGTLKPVIVWKSSEATVYILQNRCWMTGRILYSVVVFNLFKQRAPLLYFLFIAHPAAAPATHPKHAAGRVDP